MMHASMAEKALTENDNLLLRLMDKHKPHLKPYAYRLHTWNQVLYEYNAATGCVYRQVRTLKKKFEKLRMMCEDADHGQLDFGNFELLNKLVRESDEVTSSHSSRHRRIQQQEMTQSCAKEEDETAQLRADDCSIDSGSPFIIEDRNEEQNDTKNEERDEEKNEGSQPPPLDSITVGFPHTQNPNEKVISSNSTPSQPPTGGSYHVPSDASEHVTSPPLNGPPSEFHVNNQLLRSLISLMAKHYSLLNSSNRPSSAVSENDLTLEKVYSELKHCQRLQQEFQQEVTRRLDVIIARLAGDYGPLTQPNTHPDRIEKH